ncbi:NAD(P)-dependent oxidoreductase [Flectobacillus major]|uniref:NAD(P)-dependent oxidoreductase n=1 Tax=Flectobacillus major TaxID=103 RepID=UPI000418D7DE|nr:NAD(P)H-binding protein [Flectobacillus major]
MNITIIGASAGVGLETVKRALDRNHYVTTLSRSQMQINDNERLIKLKGSATSKSDLLKSIENADAVIVALGTGKSMKATTLYSDFAKLLVEIQAETKVSIPFIILTGFGAGESGKYHDSFIMKMAFKFLLNDVYADKTKMEEIIAGSSITWEIVRPGLLKDKPLTEKYRVENQLYKGINIGSINRIDVADFLVKQAENPTELYQYPALSNN